MSIYKDGFFTAELSDPHFLAAIRQKFIAVFDTLARNNSAGIVQNDANIIRLYHSDYRSLWVGAYDQLRQLPEIFELASCPELLQIAKRAGIVAPVLGAKLVVRADMPDDEKWSFPPHQDYPFNRGSLNSITIWIPFQDTPDNIAPLNVVPASHNDGKRASGKY